MQLDLLEEFTLLRVLFSFFSLQAVLKDKLCFTEMLQEQAFISVACTDGSPSTSPITSHCFEGSGITWRFPVSASSPANVPSGVLHKLVFLKSVIFSQSQMYQGGKKNLHQTVLLHFLAAKHLVLNGI